MTRESAKSAPLLLETLGSLRAWRDSVPPQARVGFVPTMGALHEGHAVLLRKMRAECEKLVLSIFVNPTQFGPKEDLSRYPRTLEADLELARQCGVDAVFFPTPELMYPPGYSTYVEEQTLTQKLCGEFRPGHFRGVTTVVLKLFNLVKPHTAYFGLKDAQQFFVLHKMARDLNLDVLVEGLPTVREPDGLALSSRNRYLSAPDRAKAPVIYRALKNAAQAIESGAVIAETLNAAIAQIQRDGLELQYLECLSLPGLAPISGSTASPHEPCLIAVAAYVGGTRLIDNVIVRPELLADQGIRVHLG